MQKFSYLRPASLEEALDLLEQHGPEVRIVAGGTDVIVSAKRGKPTPPLLVSLRRLGELAYIREAEGRVCIGGLTTLRDLERSDLIGEKLPALADAVHNMASVQIRNVATMAGNVVNAAPSADTAPPLLVSGTTVLLQSKKGTREVPLDQFFIGPGRTVCEPTEVLTEFSIPLPDRAYGQAYWKHTRRKAMDLALVGVAVHLELDDDRQTCRMARIAHGVAGPTPIRTPQAEERLVGKKITPELLAGIGSDSCGETLCRDSLRGEAWYREEIIKVMVRRMGLLAFRRAGGRERGM